MAEKLRLEDFGIDKITDAVAELSPVQTSRVTGKEKIPLEEELKQTEKASASKHK